MNEINESFFDALGTTGLEKIHSQIISWIFSNNNDCLSIIEKSKLLNEMFNLNKNEKYSKIKTITEFNFIDIVIKTNNRLFIIENKIKSSEHSNQTERYKKEMKKLKTEIKEIDKHYLFLTLIDEKSVDNTWINYTYSQLYESLNALISSKKTNKPNEIILKEYLKTLKNLNVVINKFIKHFYDYEKVFSGGGTKKSDKFLDLDNNIGQNEIMKYISNNQLETILQKLFFKQIWTEIPEAQNKYWFYDSHGTIETGFSLKDITIENIKFRLSFIIKNSTLMIEHNYSEKQILDKKNIKNIFKKYFQNDTYKRLNTTGKNKISVSNKLSKRLSEYKTMNEVKKFIKNEYETILYRISENTN